eukprot:3131564-Rhodomonas_salina.2
MERHFPRRGVRRIPTGSRNLFLSWFTPAAGSSLIVTVDCQTASGWWGQRKQNLRGETPAAAPSWSPDC